MSFIDEIDFSKVRSFDDIDWTKWRKEYWNLTIEDHRKIYNYRHNLNKSKFFSTFTVLVFLREVSAPKRIIEIGGADGSLAKVIFDSNVPIVYWDNYEISDVALSRTVCNDSRYKGIFISDKFPWELKFKKNYNALIMSDVAEHFKEEQLSTLIKNIKGLRYVYYKIPWIPSWKTYNGAHVLEMDDWNDLDEFMLKEGFKPHKIKYSHKEVRTYYKNDNIHSSI